MDLVAPTRWAVVIHPLAYFPGGREEPQVACMRADAGQSPEGSDNHEELGPENRIYVLPLHLRRLRPYVKSRQIDVIGTLRTHVNPSEATVT